MPLLFPRLGHRPHDVPDASRTAAARRFRPPARPHVARILPLLLALAAGGCGGAMQMQEFATETEAMATAVYETSGAAVGIMHRARDLSLAAGGVDPICGTWEVETREKDGRPVVVDGMPLLKPVEDDLKCSEALAEQWSKTSESLAALVEYAKSLATLAESGDRAEDAARETLGTLNGLLDVVGLGPVGEAAEEVFARGYGAIASFAAGERQLAAMAAVQERIEDVRLSIDAQLAGLDIVVDAAAKQALTSLHTSTDAWRSYYEGLDADHDRFTRHLGHLQTVRGLQERRERLAGVLDRSQGLSEATALRALDLELALLDVEVEARARRACEERRALARLKERAAKAAGPGAESPDGAAEMEKKAREKDIAVCRQPAERDPFVTVALVRRVKAGKGGLDDDERLTRQRLARAALGTVDAGYGELDEAARGWMDRIKGIRSEREHYAARYAEYEETKRSIVRDEEAARALVKGTRDALAEWVAAHADIRKALKEDRSRVTLVELVVAVRDIYATYDALRGEK